MWQVAVWESECYLHVYSEIEVEGEGWYAKGSNVELNADSPRGFLVRKVFKKWSGDVSSSSLSVSLVMNETLSVSAEWTTDYSQALLVGVVATVIVGGGGYVTVQMRRKEEKARAVTEHRKRIIDFVARSDEAVVLETYTSGLHVSEDEVKAIIEKAVGDGVLAGRFSNDGRTFITDEVLRKQIIERIE